MPLHICYPSSPTTTPPTYSPSLDSLPLPPPPVLVLALHSGCSFSPSYISPLSPLSRLHSNIIHAARRPSLPLHLLRFFHPATPQRTLLPPASIPLESRRSLPPISHVWACIMPGAAHGTCLYSPTTRRGVDEKTRHRAPRTIATSKSSYGRHKSPLSYRYVIVTQSRARC